MQVTMIHVNTVRAMLESKMEPEHIGMINNVETCLYRVYGPLGTGDLYLLRQSIMNFFEERHVKVSIFLQVRAQNHNRILRCGDVYTAVCVPLFARPGICCS